MLLVHIAVRAIDEDPDLDPETTRTSKGKVPEQALTDPEARQEDIIDVHHRKRGLGDVSPNVNDHVQEALTATQALLTIELLHHRDENLLRQCSVSEA